MCWREEDVIIRNVFRASCLTFRVMIDYTWVSGPEAKKGGKDVKIETHTSRHSFVEESLMCPINKTPVWVPAFDEGSPPLVHLCVDKFASSSNLEIPSMGWTPCSRRHPLGASWLI